MVHALQEINRVLKPAQILIDLRPVPGNSRVEVLTDTQVLPVGLVDEAADTELRLAADKAIAEVTQAGWFIQERRGEFDYEMIWESSAEMAAYIKARWSNSHLPEAVVNQAAQLMAAYPSARVRIRRRMLIARYRKAA